MSTQTLSLRSVNPSKDCPRILVAEDEDITRKLTIKTLKISSFQITTVKNGDEAIDAWWQSLKDQHAFDLILMDINMPPGLNGVSATKKIRMLETKYSLIPIPIIAYTANVEPNNFINFDHFKKIAQIRVIAKVQNFSGKALEAAEIYAKAQFRGL